MGDGAVITERVQYAHVLCTDNIQWLTVLIIDCAGFVFNPLTAGAEYIRVFFLY